MELPEEVKAAVELLKADKCAEGLVILLQLAKAETASAQWLLGQMYLGDRGLLPEAESIGWLERAAAHGHPQATYDLALHRGQDAWPPPEDTESARLLLRAAELGCADAQYDLGTLFGIGAWPSPFAAEQTRSWYRKAAEQGLATAQANLAALLLDEGRPLDEAQGLRWLQAAAEQNEPEALVRLEEAYRQGLHGLDVDTEQAESLHQRLEPYLEDYHEQIEKLRRKKSGG